MPQGNTTYALAVSADYVHMAFAESYEAISAGGFDDENDVCLAREEYSEVVSDYTLYEKTTGDRVYVNTNLQLKVDSDENTANGYESWGQVSYWGSWREDGRNFINGETVQAATYDGSEGEIYTVTVAPGRLVQYSADTLSLSELSGIVISTWLSENDDHLFEVSIDINRDFDVTDEFSVVLEPNADADGFDITGIWIETDDIREIQPVDPAVPVTLKPDVSMHMWSSQLGGEIRYVADSSTVIFFERSFVDGSEAGAGELFGSDSSVVLSCFDRCLDTELTAADVASSENEANVYIDDHVQIIRDASTIPYGFDQSNLTLTLDGTPVKFADSVTSEDLEQSPYWQWGVNSGDMILESVALDNSIYSSRDLHQSIEDGTITDFYVWETGVQSWQQRTVLVDSSGQVVQFDRPIAFKYVHETAHDRNENSDHNSKVYLIEYGGPGQLWGVPYNEVNGEYIPDVSFEDGTIMGSNGEYVIQVNEVEQKLTLVDDSNCNDLPFTAPSQPIPTGITGDVFNIGAMPDLSSEPPSLIDGELVSD